MAIYGASPEPLSPATNGPCCDATSIFRRLCQRIAQIPLKNKITGRGRLTVLQTWFPDLPPLKPPESGGDSRAARMGAWKRSGSRICAANFGFFKVRGTLKEVAEPADKPGPVLDSHSSRRNVTATLKQPTRRHCGPQCCLPIWPCSRWGLPCRPVARLAVRSYRTISPLPRVRPPFRGRTVRRYLSVALSVGSRRPGVTWHRALWSPDFPRHSFE